VLGVLEVPEVPEVLVLEVPEVLVPPESYRGSPFVTRCAFV
jgi:hypothetical protein